MLRLTAYTGSPSTLCVKRNSEYPSVFEAGWKMFACQMPASPATSPLSARSRWSKFHARIQALSSGSPWSEGTWCVRPVASGHVMTSDSATNHVVARIAVSGRSRARTAARTALVTGGTGR